MDTNSIHLSLRAVVIALGEQTALILVLMMVVMKRMRMKKVVTATLSLKDSLNFEREMIDKYINVRWLQSLLEADTSDILQNPVKRTALYMF